MSAPRPDVLAWFDKVTPALAGLFDIVVKAGVTSLSDAHEALEMTSQCRAAVAEMIEALTQIRDYAGNPRTAAANSVKKSGIARAALEHFAAIAREKYHG